MNKEIYFNVFGTVDQIVITEKNTSNEIKDLLRSIGNISETKFDCMVQAPNGSVLIDIDYHFLCSNTPTNPYKVISIHPGHRLMPIEDHSSDCSQTPRCSEHYLKKYLLHTERKIEYLEQTIKKYLATLESGLLSLSARVERLSLMSWMTSRNSYRTTSTYIDITRQHLQRSTTPCPNPDLIIPSRTTLTETLAEFKLLTNVDLPSDLKSNNFNNWLFSDAELMHLVRRMFVDCGVVAEFQLSSKKFDRWLYEVYCGYNTVPFHNFKHAFMVTQMMYSLLWAGDLRVQLSSMDILVLLTASICHDLNHPGFNNTYQINSGTELAVLYNDQSPLENHHSTYCLNLLNRSDCDLFGHLSAEQHKSIRGGIIKCILATDMSRHNDILNNFKTVLPTYDWSSQTHRDLLMMILIKSSDISNEARPLDVAAKWIECLFEEFFYQSDYEKKVGLPVAPFMDRDKVTKPASQCGFIRFVIYPLYESLSQLLPECKDHLVIPVLHQLDYYSHLDTITGAKPKSRKSIVETLSKCKFRRSSQQCSKHNYNSITHIDQLKVIDNHNEVESPRKLSS